MAADSAAAFLRDVESFNGQVFLLVFSFSGPSAGVEGDQKMHIPDRLARTLQLSANPRTVGCNFVGPIENR